MPGGSAWHTCLATETINIASERSSGLPLRAELISRESSQIKSSGQQERMKCERSRVRARALQLASGSRDFNKNFVRCLNLAC